MYRRRRGMDPAQVSSSRKLFQPQRRRENDFCVAQFRLDAFVGVALRNLQLGKLLRQALSEPLRSIPQLEPAMYDDQQLHTREMPGAELTKSSNGITFLKASFGRLETTIRSAIRMPVPLRVARP